MKYLPIIMLIAIAGCTSPSDYERYLLVEAQAYDQRPDYLDRRKKIKLPLEYPTETKLHLIAHGFDSHVRLVLASQLADQMSRNRILREQVFSFLKSSDPGLAWASAWTRSKCLDDGPDFRATYARKDVREFEKKYHE